MTVIAAVEHPGGVLVGCDSCVAAGEVLDTLDHPKWFRRRGGLLVAYAGSVRVAQAAELSPRWRMQREGEGDVDYLVNVVATAVRRAVNAAPGARNGEACYLLAYRGRVYEMAGNCVVVRSAHGYGAIGSGEAYAKGALGALLGGGTPPRDALRASLRLAERHAVGCKAPFRIVDVRWPSVAAEAP
jgi:ATP-dependent protease HslVU (ClpYQ) peptidase subunit